jgi:DNA-binding Xre family transcriptional regulator
MIKNEKQYKITKKKLADLNEAILRKESSPDPLPAMDRLILVSLQDMQGQLHNEITAYDHLKSNMSSLLDERSIDDLPELLIEFKVQSGLTQKEFSKKIGMKEQQLQRYEAENFKSISFKNLLKILHAIGLEITVRGYIQNNPVGNHSMA